MGSVVCLWWWMVGCAVEEWAGVLGGFVQSICGPSHYSVREF